MESHTFRDLYNKMLSDLSDGSFMRFSSYSVAGRSYSYRSVDEFLKLLSWVEEKANTEEGKSSYIGRSFAAQSRR